MIDRARRLGADVYLEGEPADRVYFLKRGQVALSRAVDTRSWSGAVWTVRRVGALLGLEALVQRTYLDSARALTDVTLCSAPRDVVRSWVATRAEAALAVLGCVVTAHCGDTPRRAGADGSAVERVATWLLDEPAGQAAALPRTAVAGMLGMEPETLSRALSALSECGAIRVSRREIVVLDPDRLADVSDGRRRGARVARRGA